jgi:hypothetical protein
MGRACSTHGTNEKCAVNKQLVGTSDAKKPVRRPTHRWEDNIKMDPK